MAKKGKKRKKSADSSPKKKSRVEDDEGSSSSSAAAAAAAAAFPATPDEDESSSSSSALPSTPGLLKIGKKKSGMLTQEHTDLDDALEVMTGDSKAFNADWNIGRNERHLAKLRVEKTELEAKTFADGKKADAPKKPSELDGKTMDDLEDNDELMTIWNKYRKAKKAWKDAPVESGADRKKAQIRLQNARIGWLVEKIQAQKDELDKIRKGLTKAKGEKDKRGLKGKQVRCSLFLVIILQNVSH